MFHFIHIYTDKLMNTLQKCVFENLPLWFFVLVRNMHHTYLKVKVCVRMLYEIKSAELLHSYFYTATRIPTLMFISITKMKETIWNESHICMYV